MNSVLAKIAMFKQQEIKIAKKNRPINELEKSPYAPIRDYISALKSKNPAIIAEIKKASPSKGVIRADFDVASIAQTYEQYGAACLSVLTDKEFFQGDSQNITIAKAHSTLPVLRKDFIIDSYQIYESRVLGADCILLIVAILDDHQLNDFCQLAQELDMAVLVESHTREELDRALLLPTPLMGINNRSLHTFRTDLNTTIMLAKELPSDRIAITESGINSRADILMMQEHGINTFLIGESLMREKDIGKKLTEFLEK